ncbi:MAG: DUF4338 domain-containing protein [Nitrospirae bacterium]|nr:DUF4338 domain-containing protein [Nitrospirota bacterium]
MENLHKVVCNSRFLILPGVTIANLASHVLGLSTKRLREDWQKRYGAGDGVPGTETIWRGLQRLDDLTEMWKIIMNSLSPPLKIPPVSSKTYG